MTPTECVVLVGAMRAACPAQKFDELTPDAWYRLLQPYNAGDCLDAFYELRARQVFVDVSEVITRVQAFQRRRSQLAAQAGRRNLAYPPPRQEITSGR